MSVVTLGIIPFLPSSLATLPPISQTPSYFSSSLREKLSSKALRRHIFSFRIKSYVPQDAGDSESSSPGDISHREDTVSDDFVASLETETNTASALLIKLMILLGIASTLTILSIRFKWLAQGSSTGFPLIVRDSSEIAPVGFILKAFGYQVILPEYAPGWVYFWLLMAAGFGLFVSEEALNIWVGISLARKLCLDGTLSSLTNSFVKNAPYIISTIAWVYWGVCISDMVPFYFGKLFRQTGAFDNIYSKLGIDKKKASSIIRAVKKYGNFIGFVERFSIGVRNPTSFLAGSLGLSSEYYFAGVCCGGLITLPIQLGIGFLLREHPMVALAGVATVVGIWTLFPYAIATITTLFLYLRQRYSS